MKRVELLSKIDELEGELLCPSKLTIQEFDNKLSEWRGLQVQLNVLNRRSLGEKINFTYINH